MLTTIGYEKCASIDFVETLEENQVEVLIDIRERAQSRRRGFSKTALSEAVARANIEYLHLRDLGDPKAGREAARAGKYGEFREIYFSVLKSEPAQIAISKIENIARRKRVCLMCYERDYRTCHRKIVADRLEILLDCKSLHLLVDIDDTAQRQRRRMLHSRQGAAA